MQVPSGNEIKESVEKQENLLKWLVDVWRSKNWVRVLLLLDVLIIAFFNPVVSPVAGFFNLQRWAWYTPLWCLVVALLFVAGLGVAIRATRVTSQTPPVENSARKGLRPFEFDDAQIFVRLERGENLHECLKGVTARDFRFGVLCGESGSGKSSFLQAGLWPVLLRNKHRCMYVKITELDPLESLRQSVLKQLPHFEEALEQKDFLEIVDFIGELTPEPVVLIFDQFEQFFVHRKRKNLRKSFVQALATWYQEKSSLPVKILISIRGDFTGRLIELQKVIGYSLGPQESFRIEGFEPDQATSIFRVIAETEGLKFDESFVKETRKISRYAGQEFHLMPESSA